MMRTTIWVTMTTTKWTMHYRGALKTGLPMGYSRRMMCEGVPELIQWVAKATRRIMAQKQHALKTGFVFCIGAGMHGTHTPVQ